MRGVSLLRCVELRLVPDVWNGTYLYLQTPRFCQAPFSQPHWLGDEMARLEPHTISAAVGATGAASVHAGGSGALSTAGATNLTVEGIGAVDTATDYARLLDGLDDGQS